MLAIRPLVHRLESRTMFAAGLVLGMPQSYALPAGFEAASIATADLNSDGKLDLIVPERPGSGIAVMLNNGDGTFQPAQFITTADGAYNVHVADLNSDGHPDLIVDNSGEFLHDPSVSVLLGNGDGTFQPQQLYPETSEPFTTVGDFNGDKNQDILVADGDGISLMLGRGDGTFQTARPLVAGDFTFCDSADFNQDGKLDFAVLQWQVGVSIFYGNGDGTFYNLMSGIGGVNGWLISVADAIGGPEAFVGLDGTSLEVLQDSGDGTLSVHGTFQIPDGGNYDALSTPDVNGDGMPDIVMQVGVSNDIGIYVGGHDGSFTQTLVITDPNTLVIPRAAAVDLTGNGQPDLIVVSEGSVDIFPNGVSTTTLQTEGRVDPFQNTLTMTAIVGGSELGALPTGTVTFLDDGVPAGGPVILSDGLASFTSTVLAPGAYSFTAVYSGDSGHVASVSQAVAKTVAAPLEVVSSSNPAVNGSTIEFTVHIPSTDAGVVPSGKVVFFDGNMPLAALVDIVNGAANLSISSLTTGTHQIIAAYINDAGDLLANTLTLNETIIDPILRVSLSGKHPLNVIAGRRLRLRQQVLLQTTSTIAHDVFAASILLSPDEYASDAVITLAAISRDIRMPAHRIRRFRLAHPERLSASIAPGTYHILIATTDSDGQTVTDSGKMLQVIAASHK